MLITGELTTQDRVVCTVQSHNHSEVKSNNLEFQTYK